MILLSKVPRHYETYFVENSESLALGSLAAYLRRHGHEVVIFDASLEGLDLDNTKAKVLSLINQHSPLLIGFTIADMTFIESTIETVNYLREAGVASHITMGGHSPTFDYGEILSMCGGLDSVIRYEGELPLLALADSLRNSRDWHNIPNIAFISNGEVKANSPAPLIADLDSLPFPSRDYLPYVFENLNEIGIVPMTASRGCYNNCGFCSIRSFYGPPDGPLWRARSVENIVAEIGQLKKQWPFIREIVFVDDLFLGLPSKRMERLLSFREKLAENNLNLLLSISERVDNITEEIGLIWNEMGVRQILIGLESGITGILQKMNKRITLEDQQRAIKILDKHEIDPTPSFINFTPWSTIDNIIENTKYFLSLEINLLQGLLNRFQIYHGTPLATELKKDGLVYGEFPNLSYHTPDARVDRLYEIVQKNFGPYLFTAYRLKLLERELRFALFEARAEKDEKSIAACINSRDLYKKLMIKIMEEATSLFISAAELVRDELDGDLQLIDAIQNDIYNKADEWVKMIEIFRNLCPVLKTEKGGLNAATRI